jgi:hypothetical protein
MNSDRQRPETTWTPPQVWPVILLSVLAIVVIVTLANWRRASKSAPEPIPDDAAGEMRSATADGGLMSYRPRMAALWTVVIVSFAWHAAASLSNSTTGSAGGFVAAGAVTAIIRQRRRREAWLDHLEWHRQHGTRCPDQRNGEPPPWGVPPPH